MLGQLTKTIPINIAVEPTISILSLHLYHAQTPEQVPVIRPPNNVPISRTAPEQS